MTDPNEISSSLQKRFGLALSGGGFRASLYHLGVIRFLRDAGLLRDVSHITSVSGGSIIGAHLVLNWDRYCGTEDEFQAVADELLAFVQMDVRNRIVRRFPLFSLANTARKAIRLELRRQFTRAGLLEQHYERFLYGDIGLFDLPNSPAIYILATNLNEGSLCAFHRDGLLLQRRSRSGKEVAFERHELGLATVPMAVAASSAFPGFFPPLELEPKDVGAREGAFDRHSFTDGGIYDNVGLRMFQHLREMAQQRNELTRTLRVTNAKEFTKSVVNGASSAKETPLSALSEKIVQHSHGVQAADLTSNDRTSQLLMGLVNLTRAESLYHHPDFQSLPVHDPRARAALHRVKTSGREPDDFERVWLNCELASSALHEVTGIPSVSSQCQFLDGVFVSDAGASFKIRSGGRAGGLFRTALRSTDILMDRVNQLELEAFTDTMGVLFLPISRMVSAEQDPLAPHPEIQRQAASIRTDMDRFSALEISSLVRHGYCVARQILRENHRDFAVNIPSGRPWNPTEHSKVIRSRAKDLGQTNKVALSAARRLQASSARRTLSTLLDFRDWPSFIWAIVVLLILVALPSFLISRHRSALRQGYVSSALKQSSPLHGQVLDLLASGPQQAISPIEFKEVAAVEPIDFTGYDVVSDHRIYDLRGWSNQSGGPSNASMHAQFRFQRTNESAGEPHFRIQLPSTKPSMQVQYQPAVLNPKHYRAKLDSGLFVYESQFDVSHVPVGSEFDLKVDQILPPNMANQSTGAGHFKFTIAAKTGLVRIWLLLAEGRQHDRFELYRRPLDAPDQVELVKATNIIDLPIGSIASFELINPKNYYRYECRWQWRDDSH